MHISARNPNRKNAHKGGSGPLISTEYCYTIETGQPHYVLDIPKSTSMPPPFIQSTSLTTKTMETSPRSTQKSYPASTFLSEASLVRLFQSLESEEGLRIPEGRYSLNLREYCEQNGLGYFSLKTLKDFSATTTETLSKPSSKRLMNWGMTSNGKCLTARITECHKTERGSSLSDILEANVDRKYFLSPTASKRILLRSLTAYQIRKGSMRRPELEKLLRDSGVALEPKQGSTKPARASGASHRKSASASKDSPTTGRQGTATRKGTKCSATQ